MDCTKVAGALSRGKNPSAAALVLNGFFTVCSLAAAGVLAAAMAADPYGGPAAAIGWIVAAMLFVCTAVRCADAVRGISIRIHIAKCLKAGTVRATAYPSAEGKSFAAAKLKLEFLSEGKTEVRVSARKSKFFSECGRARELEIAYCPAYDDILILK